MKTGAIVVLPKETLSLEGWGDGDGVVECQTEGFVSIITAFVEEQILVEVVPHGEKCTACGVGNDVPAIGTQSALVELIAHHGGCRGDEYLRVEG